MVKVASKLMFKYWDGSPFQTNSQKPFQALCKIYKNTDIFETLWEFHYSKWRNTHKMIDSFLRMQSVFTLCFSSCLLIGPLSSSSFLIASFSQSDNLASFLSKSFHKSALPDNMSSASLDWLTQFCSKIMSKINEKHMAESKIGGLSSYTLSCNSLLQGLLFACQNLHYSKVSYIENCVYSVVGKESLLHNTRMSIIYHAFF